MPEAKGATQRAAIVLAKVSIGVFDEAEVNGRFRHGSKYSLHIRIIRHCGGKNTLPNMENSNDAA